MRIGYALLCVIVCTLMGNNVLFVVYFYISNLTVFYWSTCNSQQSHKGETNFAQNQPRTMFSTTHSIVQATYRSQHAFGKHRSYVYSLLSWHETREDTSFNHLYVKIECIVNDDIWTHTIYDMFTRFRLTAGVLAAYSWYAVCYLCDTLRVQ